MIKTKDVKLTLVPKENISIQLVSNSGEGLGIFTTGARWGFDKGGGSRGKELLSRSRNKTISHFYFESHPRHLP